MFPFWSFAIAPVLEATHARRVLEIGALRGETTAKVMERLGPDAELHVIDPAPQFDPAEHERRFPGRYVFHRDLSLRVLPDLPAVDVALIDGDHNWYTVFHELRLLAASARAEGRPLPVLLMHDVGWPYGRRDLYYAPETIPEAYRQPSARRGIARRRSALAAEGGLNAGLCNALEEGGPRNGVLTALEDFLHEHAEPVRTLVLPVYFGLAVVAEESRLAAEPELAAAFERLGGLEVQQAMTALADSLWAENLVRQVGRVSRLGRQADAAADRYLELLKGALLDEHYLDNELRVHYYAQCARKGREPDPRVVAQPALHMADELERLEAQRRHGRTAGDGLDNRPYFPYTVMGRARLDHLARCLDTLDADEVGGDLVECGTGHGGGAIYMRGHLEARGVEERTVWVADPFAALPEPPSRARRFHPMTADVNAVRTGFARLGLLDERVRFLQGRLPDAVQDAPLEAIALLRLGEALDGSPRETLDALYDKVTCGGFVVVEDGGVARVRESVERFRAEHGIEEPLERVDAGAVAWRKLVERAPADAAVSPGGLLRTPLAPPAPPDAVDLTVVVVFHDMRREAERTLHSLSRAYQEGIESLTYEVVAVENGSAPDQVLGEEFVRGFGPEFRYVDLGAEARPSPVHALNRGIAESRGRVLALMIDGAHVLSPGVLRHAMAGLELYAPAVVATRRLFVGPGLQFESVEAGYDTAYEDRLFDAIGWPARGYELFSISHFVGDADWFDPSGESNCLFVPRELLEQAGGLDEAFAHPGGELANLDVYERLWATPGVRLVALLGEATFHQVHGGSTTNVSNAVERRRRITLYHAKYEERRHRRFRVPAEPMHYVGHLGHATLRTKPRWHAAPDVMKRGGGSEPGARPETPVLMEAQLTEAYVDAYWHSLNWEETSWLGQPVRRSPADLMAYQELITRLRPPSVVVVGDEDGTLERFLTSICGLVGHGDVVVVNGDPEQARRVGARDALVFLAGTADRTLTLERFDACAPLVPVGGYVVVENTIIGGHPVWPSFGPSPMQAVRKILKRDQRFTADKALERFGPTFNRMGYLRRVSP